MSMIAGFRRITIAEMAALRRGETTIATLRAQDGGIDIDKAWAAIHFLLTGTVDAGEWPFYDIVLGGEGLGEGDLRLHSSEDVGELARALAPLSRDLFITRYDPARLTSEAVYPEVWNESWARDYVADYYQKLRDYYLAAAERSDGMLLWIR